jgi:tetratricopeptide (TPR) repeat protein
MTRFVAMVCVVAVLAADPARAEAPAKKPSAAQLARAREHFKKGQAFHASGQYDQAITEYQAAYHEAPLPDLLFNLAQVQRLKGDKQTALDNYLAYLEQAPAGRGADESRQWAAALSRELREAEAARRQHDEEEAKRLRAERDAERHKALAPAPPPRGQGLRIAGIATGAAGVVALGVGTYFALHARSLSNQQNDLSEWDPGLVSDGKAANRNAIIAFSVGGAALVTGGVLYYLGVRAGRVPADAQRVAVVPSVSSQGAGLVVGGRF